MRIFATTLFLLASFQLFATEIGDDVRKTYSAHEYTHFSHSGQILNIAEPIETLYASYNARGQMPVLLMAQQAEQPLGIYGILDREGDTAFFYFDLNGDGKVDYKSEKGLFPNWLLFKAQLKRDYPQDFITICKQIYEQYNAETGPDNKVLLELFNKVIAKGHDVSSVNFDLYFSLNQFLENIKVPEITFCASDTTSRYLWNSYDKLAVPLLLLYTGEALMNLNRGKDALVMFEFLAGIDPQSKIAAFYIGYLTSGLTGDDKLLNEFTDKNPNFWTLNSKPSTKS